MISKEEVENLSHLARLELRPGEVENLQKDISNILDYVGQVNTLEGSDEKSVSALRNVMREDTPHGEASLLFGKREALLRALPQMEEEYAIVRKIIQKDE